ncbi:hypothetical protein BX286_4243 [Streptomyces sp. 3211.6]|nr:hypothetical protein BX286_4243 [Streptomyces sp. 3211.6]
MTAAGGRWLRLGVGGAPFTGVGGVSGASRQSTVLSCRSGLSRALLRRVAPRSPAATLDRPARPEMPKTVGKPPKERHGPTSGSATRSGNATARSARQTGHPAPLRSHPPGRADGRPRSLRAPPVPASARRQGLIPTPHANEDVIGTGGRHRSLRAPPVSASDGRPGPIPAPHAHQDVIGAAGRHRSLRASRSSAAGRLGGLISAQREQWGMVGTSGGGRIPVLAGWGWSRPDLGCKVHLELAAGKPVVGLALVVQGKAPHFLWGDAGARPAQRSIKAPASSGRSGPFACGLRWRWRPPCGAMRRVRAGPGRASPRRVRPRPCPAAGAAAVRRPR